jgi:D-beta-D-heptose 7-phosphate kinase/D-beta-D-heptose 1-phosphate adenosyltransferase
MGKKIQKLENLLKMRKRLRADKKKVVFTNGCFDLLHSGHIHLFRKAKKLGDILIVAVNDDASVKTNKGPLRPIFPLRERLEILEAIEDIDYLTSFSEETPQRIISRLLPDVLAKGGDWGPNQVVGRKEVEQAGGRVVIIPYLEGRSTSEIIDKIFQSGTKARPVKKKSQKPKRRKGKFKAKKNGLVLVS